MPVPELKLLEAGEVVRPGAAQVRTHLPQPAAGGPEGALDPEAVLLEAAVPDEPGLGVEVVAEPIVVGPEVPARGQVLHDSAVDLPPVADTGGVGKPREKVERPPVADPEPTVHPVGSWTPSRPSVFMWRNPTSTLAPGRRDDFPS